MSTPQQPSIHFCLLLVCISVLHLCQGNSHDGLQPPQRFRPTPRELLLATSNGLPGYWAASHFTLVDEQRWEQERCKQNEAQHSGRGQQLLDAAGSGDATRISQLLAIGVPIDFEGGYSGCHVTALFCAAKHGHEPVVELLLSQGAMSHLPYICEKTGPMVVERRKLPLIGAAQYGHENVVQQLLAAGAGVNLVNDNHQSALLYASMGGHIAIVEILLSAGAHVDCADFHERTALVEACRFGRQMIAQRLLRAGACVEGQGDDLRPLMEAADNGHVGIAQLLLQAGAQMDATTPRGSNAINLAAWHAPLPMLKLLLYAGANLGNAMYRDVLLFAAQQGKSDAAQLLRRYGARLPTTQQDVKRFTAAEHVHLDEWVPAILRQVDADAAACAQATREWLLMLERTQQLPRDIARLIWQFSGSAERSLLASAQEFTGYIQ